MKQPRITKNRSVHAQILRGYTITIFLIIFLVLINLLCLFRISNDYGTVNENRNNQGKTQEAVTAHFQWLDKLNASIQSGQEFTGSLDYNTCALGKWMSEVDPKYLEDQQISRALDGAQSPHQIIHSSAGDLLEMSKTDRQGAYQKYQNEIKPKADEVIQDLMKVSGRYQELAEAASDDLSGQIWFSAAASIILTIAAIAAALMYARRVAKKIAQPISAVAEWSQKLSLGEDHLDVEKINIDSTNAGSEIGIMVSSFLKMANGIQENVNVVRRVAEGDMTAFVNIRSSQDSLGKNLYHLVQSNDLMFADILKIAHSVAVGSEQIANASQEVAQSAGVQADAVTNLSETIDYANALIEENVEKTHSATMISDRIRQDSADSDAKMKQLAHSVEEIRAASEKISNIIKHIDDIAFQTNILALNAAVEAARAGEAGKGFAVVADEVRQLALKSAQAAEESKSLIENSIRKVQEGSKISVEASGMVEKISAEIEQIVELIDAITVSANSQLEGIKQVRAEIVQISDTASSNAASSEESAASCEEMSGNAAVLKQVMTKFNLRKRQEGQAYIPPEKRNDPEFVSRANENYRKAIETGRFGFEYTDE